jgi:hypothetical protein
MAQRFIEQYEVWSGAMVVELNQHHISKVEARVGLIHTLLK